MDHHQARSQEAKQARPKRWKSRRYCRFDEDWGRVGDVRRSSFLMPAWDPTGASFCQPRAPISDGRRAFCLGAGGALQRQRHTTRLSARSSLPIGLPGRSGRVRSLNAAAIGCSDCDGWFCGVTVESALRRLPDTARAHGLDDESETVLVHSEPPREDGAYQLLVLSTQRSGRRVVVGGVVRVMGREDLYRLQREFLSGVAERLCTPTLLTGALSFG